MASKGLLCNQLYYCEHLKLSAGTSREIDDFYITRESGKGLMSYLQVAAWKEEESGSNRIFFVRDMETDELAAYFSLKAGLISRNERVAEERDIDSKVEFDTTPGIEIAEFGMNDAYLEKRPERKGSGLIIFNDFIIPLIERAAGIVGVQLVYIFEIPEEELIERYQKEYGFMRLKSEDEELLHTRLRPSFDEGCIFMYLML